MWKIKNASFICFVADKNASFLFIVVDQSCQLFIIEDEKCQFYLFCRRQKKCQFYLLCCGSKLPVLFPLSQIKLPVLSLFLRIKTASFILNVTDQNYQLYLYCRRSKLIKIASFNLNVRDQNCQLFIVEDRNASFICVVADKNCQFHHCHRSKLPAFYC